MVTKSNTSLYSGFRGGPVGYGDPDSVVIADAERGTIFSKFVQERLFTDICVDQWSKWRRCIRRHNDKWFPSFKCRDLLKEVDACQVLQLDSPEKIKKFEQQYVERRSQFRRTGVGERYMSDETIRFFSSPEFDNEMKDKFGHAE